MTSCKRTSTKLRHTLWEHYPNVTPRDFIIAWWNSLAGFDSGAEYQLDVIRGLRRAEALAGAFDMMVGE